MKKEYTDAEKYQIIRQIQELAHKVIKANGHDIRLVKGAQ